IGLLVVGLVAGLTLLPLGPLHGLIRGTLVRVLQEQTGRQVEVGPLRGLLWTGLRVDGLRIAEEGGFARGSLVAVERIRLGWNLLALLFHRDEPLRALNAITVESPNIVVRRQADGVWELARLLQPKTPRPKTPFRFGGTITLRDARLRVIDEVAEKTGYSLAQIIEDVDLEARFDGQGDARFTFSARDAEVADQIIIRNGRIALLAPSYTRIASIDAELDARGLRLDAGAKIINVFLARWAVLHGGQITSLQGPLSLRLVDTAPGAKEAPVFDVGLALTAQLRNLDAEVRAFGKPFREVDGTLGIEMVRRDGQGPGRRDRITVTAGRGMAGSTPVRVDGAINDFRQRLSFDLRVRSDALVVSEIANALPKIPALRPLRGYGTSRVDVGVSGQLTNLRLYGWAQPGGVGWGDWATVAGGLVRFDLRRTPPNQGLAGLAGRLELNNVSGRTRFVNAPLRRIYGQVSLGPDRLTFHRLRLLAGEAAVAVDGRIDRVTQPRRQVLALAVAA
ncbi:MAG: hypothetical protein HUU35_20415, partial [Armatimonadetes bacterium]|nr:hypothetical protein [Armatimonadota bacterium]